MLLIMLSIVRLTNMDIAHLAIGGNTPGLNRIVVINRCRAAHCHQLFFDWLDMTTVIHRAALQQRRLATPRPTEIEARQALGQHRGLQSCSFPVAPAIGADIDPLDLAASAPGQTRDVVVALSSKVCPPDGLVMTDLTS